MELQDWAAVIAIISGMVTMIGGFAAVLVTFTRKIDALDTKVEDKVGALDKKIDALDAKVGSRIDDLDTKLENKIDTKVDGLRAEMVERFDEVNSRLQVLEQRTYDIGSRLPAVNG